MDSSTIYNSKDYRVDISATALPNTTYSNEFTTGWLSVYIANGASGFFQVGLMAFEDGLRWFAFTYDPDGMTCWHGGEPYWIEEGVIQGCRGQLGDIVSLNTWHTVQIVGYLDNNHWIARVYDANDIPYDVAEVISNSTRIYRANVAFEEGFSVSPDPSYLGRFFFYHPQYKSGGTWLDWSQTTSPVSSMSQVNYIWTPSSIPLNTFCPSQYGARLNLNADPRFWFAGTAATYAGGIRCDWWLIPPVVGAGTHDDALTSSLIYQRTINGGLDIGDWDNTSPWPKAYANTVSYTPTQNDKVTLTFTGSRITRLYTMASNRVQEEVFVDGYSQGQLNDYASTTRWQVAKTWPMAAYGTHTIEVQKIGSSGYIDLDAFIVDIPYVNAGTYDGTHANYKYIGSWTLSSPWPLAYNQTLHWSKNTENAFTFTFYGNSIYYYYTKASNRGKAAVTIDGVNMPLIDLYSASTVWQAQTTYTNLGTGIHTILISVSRQKNANSSDYYVDVDKLIVP